MRARQSFDRKIRQGIWSGSTQHLPQKGEQAGQLSSERPESNVLR